MRLLTAALSWGFGVSQARGEGPSGSELLGLGLVLAASVLVPLFAGIGVDALLHSSPIGLLLGLVAGITAASVMVFQRFKRYLT
jgi:F0F1-type ATP synthase assembly protein I